MQRAKIGMFGYVRRWLKWGLISPRASSIVEWGHAGNWGDGSRKPPMAGAIKA